LGSLNEASLELHDGGPAPVARKPLVLKSMRPWNGRSPGDDLTGLELARQFFHETVAPVVARAAPTLRYTAGRFGARSDASGFDDAISRDHGWGPGCTLLIDPAAAGHVAVTLDTALRNELPLRFRGYSTSYRGMTMTAIDHPPVQHDVEIRTPEQYLHDNLGVASAFALSVTDWLAIDEQKLFEVIAGELFRDDLEFARTRERLAFYPADVRLHLICVEWEKISDEQAFPGRTGARGDEAGSAIVLARLAERAMRLCFYIEHKYPPYSKWFGSALQRLACGSALYATITQMLTTARWDQRDLLWAEVVRRLISVHEEAGLLEAGKYHPAPVYIGRPGTGLPQFERGGPPSIRSLIDEIRNKITAPEVRALPHRLGSINQMAASRDLEEDWPRWRAALAKLYQGG
jgi:hypothetical protein